MNRLVLTSSLAFALSCGAVFAQQAPDAQQVPDAQQTPAQPGGPHHHAPNPQRQAHMIAQRFNLNADQTLQVQHIMETRDQQLEALHGNTQLSPEDRHQQARTINDQSDQQLGTILTPDQMSQLKAMRHHRMHNHEEQENGTTGQAPSV